MLVSTYRSQLIDRISMLSECFHIASIPQSVLEATIAANPWFTESYIAQSLDAIRTWLHTDRIWDFVKKYPNPSEEAKQVGIIAAGNIPLVGFHDVLITLLSGNIAQVKCSHQDKVLMEWIRESWIRLVPQLEKTFHIVPHLASPDFLIATGNNNSARYFHSTYRDIERIVRKSRFSVAILRNDTSDEEIRLLCQDILLYNGLGCRNVSNVILEKGFRIKRLVNQLNSYKQYLINPLYLERVLYEKSRREVLELEFIQTKNLLILPSEDLDYTTMGTIRVVEVQNEEEIEKYLASASQRIQCTVGVDTIYGQTQFPSLDTFADDIDIMAILTDQRIEERS